MARQLTVGSIVIDDTTHAHLRDTFQQSLGHNAICLGNASQSTSHSKDSIVDAGNDLGHTGANSSLVAQLGNILSLLANDDSGFLGRDNCAQGELLLGILLFGARWRLAFTTTVGIAHTKPIEALVEVIASTDTRLIVGHFENCRDMSWRSM
jgi:hypothetical protein